MVVEKRLTDHVTVSPSNIRLKTDRGPLSYYPSPNLPFPPAGRSGAPSSIPKRGGIPVS